MREVIHRVNGYGKDAYTYYPVVIIGAGESGIAMACKLKQELGFDQFRLFDRQAGIGGTWWINRYPGVACDIPAVFYSFSFSPSHKWWSPGPEMVGYLQGVCEEYAITDKVQLNTDIKTCRWLEDEELWEVQLCYLVHGMGDLSAKDREKLISEQGERSVYSAREIIKTKVICSAVGGLVEPRGWPEEIPGKDRFQGEIFHSARWDYNVDLKDKDVVVVGTGCSAAQFVPLLAPEYGAKSVTQLMRSPPWVVPRPTLPGGEAWLRRWGPYIPGLSRFIRTAIALSAEYDFRYFKMGDWNERERQAYEVKLLRFLRETVPEKYHEILTPDYGVGCKRRIFDASWYRSLQDPRIELTTQPLTSVQERSVTIGPGRTYPNPSVSQSKEPVEERTIPADVVILANGFDVSKWLHPLAVKGKGGRDLVDLMEERGGPQAYNGTAMDGFPNFFIVFGPNTATGHSSVIMASENQVNYALKFIKPILDGDATTVDVKREAEMAYTRDIQRALKGTVFNSGGCSSWYVSKETGWNSTVYPYTQIHFTWRSMFPRYSDWNIAYTRKGLLKLWLGRSVRVVAFAAVLLGAYRARQAGLGTRDLTNMAVRFVDAVQVHGRKLFRDLMSSV
ncbi:FAD/NAD(P)-binding domain-containing protein [Saccharata proteae CBS 121410]|uniref:FAD/NAD(P)-binding domain-containing protein n=1 Tax=Saccharata proteae CBS 121410 TaxID=1314787 RepID=A0A6A5YBM7_9PEZI|nr:FAD/NAD(P)-binding domain-containing protein [Saccharata proteae CBS 121410]